MEHPSVTNEHEPNDSLPHATGTVRVYSSAKAVFFAPSDLSGLGGMHHEQIRATSSWRGGPPRYDCVYVGNAEARDDPGFSGLNVARVKLFFSVKHRRKVYPCALVHWYSHVGNTQDPVTGLWRVQPDYDLQNRPCQDVIPLDSIMRGAHLIGVAGEQFLPHHNFDSSKSLDAFDTFYVNKYADHHSHEIAF